MRETMGERLQRQRREYDDQIDELNANVARLEQQRMFDLKTMAKLEAKLEMLALLLDEHTPR